MKEPISDKHEDSRTAHWQPIIDFLKAQDNESTTDDKSPYNWNGYGVYGFAQPLDKERFRYWPPTLSASTIAGHK